ncbi:hypothetical protein DFH11DRAFT_1269838 [Phellopilus nigrolimitatus]|nr:hypothetical protein DFH11DRAFT_1269838 [Phellopilus nigrolimitatus]
MVAFKVFEIDLRQRRSEKIYDHKHDHQLAFMMPHNLRLQGTQAHGLYPQGDHIVLVGNAVAIYFFNWKSSSYATFRCDKYIEASRLVCGFLFTIHRPVDPAVSFILRATDVHQALETVSGKEGTPSFIHMNTSPAVTKVVFRFDSGDPNSIDMQAYNAFWRKDGDIYICLFASFLACSYDNIRRSIMVLHSSFTPRTRTFGRQYTESPLQLDGDHCSSVIVSSQTGRIAVRGWEGLYGSDIHRIFRDGPSDRLCRKVLRRGIACYGMDPYSGAILWGERRSSSSKPGEVRISYFD